MNNASRQDLLQKAEKEARLAYKNHVIMLEHIKIHGRTPKTKGKHSRLENQAYRQYQKHADKRDRYFKRANATGGEATRILEDVKNEFSHRMKKLGLG
jgi:hypothetical protein